MAYMPFGEILATQKNTNYAVPYLFTSKELDSETGMYYFGARYYDPNEGRWWGVDPLAEKHPENSEFVYCFGNPVRFIDPTGMEGEEDDPPAIPDIPKFSYGSNVLLNAVSVVDNTAINLLNGGIGLINSGIATASTIYNQGFGGYAEALSNEVVGIGASFKSQALSMYDYHSTNSFSQQMSDLGSSFLNPQLYENTLTFGASIYLGGKVTASGSRLSFSGNAAKGSTGALDGSFSVFNWKGYPAGGVKPTGPFRLLEGAEYTSARNLANSTNLTMRRANPEMFKGLQIHEIHPVKFGGSPTSLSNKAFLTPAQHAEYTNFWNSLLRSTK